MCCCFCILRAVYLCWRFFPPHPSHLFFFQFLSGKGVLVDRYSLVFLSVQLTVLSLLQLSLAGELVDINVYELFSYSAKCQMARTSDLTFTYIQHLKAAAKSSPRICRSLNMQKTSRTVGDWPRKNLGTHKMVWRLK